MANPELKVADLEGIEQVEAPVEPQKLKEEAEKVAAELKKDMEEVANAVEKAAA